jgi:RNA polymerase sigma-70 factor (sigma-E family)
MDDDEAYLEYVGARSGPLRRLAYLLTGEEHQADDLVQETLTKLYMRWRRVRSADNPDAYVHAMLVRTFIDDRRRGWWKVRLTGTVPELTAPDPATPPEDRALLRAALATVPPRQQAVLVLRFVHDLPVEEVAQLLGCSAGTVKSQSARGLARLRRHLGSRASWAGGQVAATGGHS